MQFTFCLSAYTRRSPSSGLRGHALLLLLNCVQYAPNATIAPRTLQQVRTQKNNRAACRFRKYAPEPLFPCVPTHCAFIASAYPRTEPLAPLRTHALNLLAPLRTHALNLRWFCVPWSRAEITSDAQIWTCAQEITLRQFASDFSFINQSFKNREPNRSDLKIFKDTKDAQAKWSPLLYIG